MHGSLSDEDVDRTIARLTRRVNQLQSTVAALLAERNRAEVAAREAASSALAGVAPDGPSHAAATLLRCVIDSLEGRMCILAEDGTVLGSNKRWDEAIGALGLPGSGLGTHFFTLTRSLPVSPDDRQRLHDTVLHVLVGEEEHAEVKLRWVWGDDEEHVVVRAHAVNDHDHARAVLSIVDITSAMSIQEELRQITKRAQLLALVAEHTDNAVVIQDAAGRIEWVNDAFLRHTGFHTPQEVVGRSRMDLWLGPFTDTEEFTRLVASIEAGHSVDQELPAQSLGGRDYWVQLQVKPVMVDGQIVRFVGVERDITERRHAEEQLRATSQRVHALAEEVTAEKSLLDGVLASIPHLVYWKVNSRFAQRHDASALHYSGVNQAFLGLRRLADRDQVIGHTEAELPVHDELTDLLPPLEAEVFQSGIARHDLRVNLHTGPEQRQELMLSVLPYRGQPDQEIAGVIGVAADITHLSELERQLAQASRLESIGQLAAGIAHEINTPVQYVSDNTRFVADGVGRVLTSLREVNDVVARWDVGGDAASDPDLLGAVRTAATLPDLDFLDTEIPSALAQSQEGLQRVAEIVKAMKDYSHPGAGRAAADLNRAVESTVKVCRNEWKYVAEVELDLDPTVTAVPCYEGELKQVLLNIIINAAQAIGEHRATTGSTALGRIRVSTALDGERVRIMIQDDGPGMDAHVRQRVFDPFFTTKAVGKGTGQGLTMAYAVIVNKHGGRLEVDSAPGRGATFSVTLPLNVAED
ncbi:MAG: PAS domain S-box protein [Kineosporiaceae bacterium]|nr:PAS domain S-box protein [Kineosporiaceae bacterium]